MSIHVYWQHNIKVAGEGIPPPAGEETVGGGRPRGTKQVDGWQMTGGKVNVGQTARVEVVLLLFFFAAVLQFCCFLSFSFRFFLAFEERWPPRRLTVPIYDLLPFDDDGRAVLQSGTVVNFRSRFSVKSKL